MPTPDMIPKGAFLDLPCSKQPIEIGRECKKYQIDPIILETIFVSINLYFHNKNIIINMHLCLHTSLSKCLACHFVEVFQ